MADLADLYLGEAIAALVRLRDEQLGQIRQAAGLLAESWAGGGCLWVARTGHSLHTELVGRAGGPVAVQVLEDGGASYDDEVQSLSAVRPHDLVLIHANQSRAGKAVSIAKLSKRVDASVVTFVQSGYDRASDLDSRYSGRASVVDLADVAVDLGGHAGDAVLPVPRSTSKMCPTSGTVGVAAAWAMIALAAEILGGRGRPPAFLRSVFLVGGLAHNRHVRHRWWAERH